VLRPHRLPRPVVLFALAFGLVAGACGGTLYDATGVPKVDPLGCGDSAHVCGGVCVSQDVAACGDTCAVCSSAPPNGSPDCRADTGSAFACTFKCDANFRACGGECLPQIATACGAACTDCTASGPVANGAHACADQGGGAYACDFTCDPGFFKVNGGCVRPVAVAAGQQHTCAIVDGGALLCWGANGSGELGPNATGASSVSPRIVFASGVSAVTAGGRHTCAIASGSVACWGANDLGQLGRGTTGAATATPAAVSGGLTGVTRLAAGANHTCALTGAGAVRCWGANAAGQSGTGTATTSVNAPGAAAIASGATAIAAGGGTTCASTSAGELRCWGANASGQVGAGGTGAATSPTAVALPAAAAPPLTLLGLAVGGAHACALVSGTATGLDGLHCWGADGQWQLGDGGAASPGSTTPLRADRLDQQSRIDGLVAAGGEHTCAWRTGDASLKCGGRADELQVGVPVPLAANVDRLDVTPGGAPVALAAGQAHTCVLTQQVGGLELRCWGRNAEGQLGRATAGGAPDGTPVLVP